MEIKKIFKERPDIEKKVMEKWPVDPLEGRCKNTRHAMKIIREAMAKRLYNEPHE